MSILNVWTAVALNNPVKGIETKLDTLNTKMDRFIYWINPFNWIKEATTGAYHLVSSGSLDIPLMALTIVAIWAIMLGAQKPKRWAFWTWIIFWTLRGVVWA